MTLLVEATVESSVDNSIDYCCTKEYNPCTWAD